MQAMDDPRRLGEEPLYVRTSGFDVRHIGLAFIGVPPRIAAPEGQLCVEQGARRDEAEKRDHQHHGIDVDQLLLPGRFHLRLFARHRLVR